jgi:hypothetical protein
MATSTNNQANRWRRVLKVSASAAGLLLAAVAPIVVYTSGQLASGAGEHSSPSTSINLASPAAKVKSSR